MLGSWSVVDDNNDRIKIISNTVSRYDTLTLIMTWSTRGCRRLLLRNCTAGLDRGKHTSKTRRTIEMSHRAPNDEARTTRVCVCTGTFARDRKTHTKHTRLLTILTRRSIVMLNVLITRTTWWKLQRERDLCVYRRTHTHTHTKTEKKKENPRSHGIYGVCRFFMERDIRPPPWSRGDLSSYHRHDRW